MPTFAIVARDATHHVTIDLPLGSNPNFDCNVLARAEAVRLGLVTEDEAKLAPVVFIRPNSRA